MALAGSASQLFGAGQDNAWQSQVSAQLSAMDMKLDDIIKLQKQTIQLQLDAMKMIRDLALMVDDYHQTEMRSLTELKDDADLMELTQKDFYGNLKKYQLFESIIGSNYFDRFTDCQRGINDAFGKLSADENPILSIYLSLSILDTCEVSCLLHF